MDLHMFFLDLVRNQSEIHVVTMWIASSRAQHGRFESSRGRGGEGSLAAFVWARASSGGHHAAVVGALRCSRSLTLSLTLKTPGDENADQNRGKNDQ